MLVCYVAGPYRAETISGVRRNIEAARAVAEELWKMGFAVICPHLNTQLMDGIAPDEVFLNGDLEILSRCDLIVMLPNWRESIGAAAEKEFAWNGVIRVYFWPEDQRQLVDLAQMNAAREAAQQRTAGEHC